METVTVVAVVIAVGIVADVCAAVAVVSNQFEAAAVPVADSSNVVLVDVAACVVAVVVVVASADDDVNVMSPLAAVATIVVQADAVLVAPAADSQVVAGVVVVFAPGFVAVVFVAAAVDNDTDEKAYYGN